MTDIRQSLLLWCIWRNKIKKFKYMLTNITKNVDKIHLDGVFLADFVLTNRTKYVIIKSQRE